MYYVMNDEGVYNEVKVEDILLDGIITTNKFDVTAYEKSDDKVKVERWKITGFEYKVDYKGLTVKNVIDRFASPTVDIAVQGTLRPQTKAGALGHIGSTVMAKDYKTGSRIKMTPVEKALKEAGTMNDVQLAKTVEQMMRIMLEKGMEIPSIPAE
jgi:hypothetical protein